MISVRAGPSHASSSSWHASASSPKTRWALRDAKAHGVTFGANNSGSFVFYTELYDRIEMTLPLNSGNFNDGRRLALAFT